MDMKHVVRIFIFSCFALFLTSYWNKGFLLPATADVFGKSALALTIVFVLIRPLAKIIFLPLNLLTLGLFNFVLYLFMLHVLSSSYHLFGVEPWTFERLQFLSLVIPKTYLSYTMNLVLSSISLSGIINALDQLT